MVVDEGKNNEKCLKERSSKDEEMELDSAEEGKNQGEMSEVKGE